MFRIIFIFFLLFVIQSGGCSEVSRPCTKDINCLKGEYCVAGQCQKTIPPGLQMDPTLEEDAVQNAEPEPILDEPTPEPKPHAPCTSDKDCIHNTTPHCQNRRCEQGYLYFDFRKGILLIDVQKVGIQCQTNDNCSPGVPCRSIQGRRVCLFQGKKNPSSGQLLDEPISLVDAPYARLIQKEGQPFVQLISSTQISEKLTQSLVLDIALSELEKEMIDINGTTVRAQLLNIRDEFTPVKQDSLGIVISGKIQIEKSTNRVALGKTIRGQALLILQEPTEENVSQ